MSKTVVIIGTLDTKGEEVQYLKDRIELKSCKTVVIDTGILGDPLIPGDITREDVANSGGTSLQELIRTGDEGEAIRVMADGALRVTQDLLNKGRLDGVLAVGGSMGTSLGLFVMRGLPLGVPKLMVSAVAFTPLITPDMVSQDLTMMATISDIWGLNRITEQVLESAAGAIVGMVEGRARKKAGQAKPLVGITTLGTAALKYVPYIKPLLKDKGYETAVFPSAGTSVKSFEQLIHQGEIAGALDLCVLELINGLFGGSVDAGPDRMEAAGRKGIPQVVAPGGLHFLAFPGSLEELAQRFKGRRIHQHNPLVTLVKTSMEEIEATAKLIATKLSRAKGPTAVVIPTRGFLEWDKPGGIFYDPEGDKAFSQTLKKHIDPRVEVIELDVHINDPAFSEQVVAVFDSLMRKRTTS